MSSLDPSDLPDLPGPRRAPLPETLEPLTLKPRGETHLGPIDHGKRSAPLDLPSHLHYVAPIGVGGVGEVHRVRDARLGRTLALKVLRGEWAQEEGLTTAFLGEARLTAQLEHPGIVPIYDVGHLGDGRPYFTMKEVRGRTLGQVIWQHHQGQGEGRPSLRRLLDVFSRVCEAVDYAHDKGVVHRDLKPGNIMVGAFGEALVMDWGLGRLASKLAKEGGGRIEGTPAYMPPEVVAGESPGGMAQDVYALGAILYQLLTGEAPYRGEAEAILKAIAAGPPRPLPRTLPLELSALVEGALARGPLARTPGAGALVEGLRGYLEGDRRRSQALRPVQEADAILSEIHQCRARGEALRLESVQMLRALSPFAKPEEKAQAWAVEDSAREATEQGDYLEVRYLQLLRGALTLDPDLLEAHRRLASFYRRRHGEAELGREHRLAAQAALLLEEHDREGRHARYLSGEGRLSISTAPSDAEIFLYRYHLKGRRQVLEPLGSQGRSPLDGLALAWGSYLLECHHEGYEVMRLPVFIERGQHCQLGPAGGGPIPMAPLGVGGDDAVYVPGGLVRLGGDPNAEHGLPAMVVDVPGFVMERYPVTNRRYIAFLEDLVAQGRRDEAVAHMPRLTMNQSAGWERPGPYALGDDGRITLQADSDGDVWGLDWPVCLVSFYDGLAFARWWADKTGLPWRLPGELEWEKAARGADGRHFPWGDHFEASWARTRDTEEGQKLPVSVFDLPEDVSPYGIRGLAGNMRDWCLDPFYPDGPPCPGGRYIPPLDQALLQAEESQSPRRGVLRGGGWFNLSNACRAANRLAEGSDNHLTVVGFRLCFSWG